jgi:hypothetical protein
MLHFAAHISACDIAHCVSIDCTYPVQREEGVWSEGVTAAVTYGREVISQSWEISVQFS